MSRTVGNVIDRVFRDWLYPADDQPSRAVLNGAITDSATSLSYLDSFLIVEEEFLLAPGQLIEIGSELVIVGDSDGSGNTISDLRRGANGTTAAAHADGTLITISPMYSRQGAFDVLRNTIARLYPRLYQRKSVAITAAATVEIPREARVLEGFVYLDSSELKTIPVAAYDFPGAATERLLVFSCEDGESGYLLYRAPFTLPTSEADLLEDDLGLDPEFEDLLVYAVASAMVASRDFDAASVETLHKQLGGELFPVGSAIRIRRELKIMYEELLEELHTNLRARSGTPNTVHGWT